MKERPHPPPEEKDDGKGFERLQEFTRRIVRVPKSELPDRKPKGRRKAR
jgi:hypothetical protein